MSTRVSIFDKVRRKLKTQSVPNSIDGAIKWYRDQIKKFGHYSKENLLTDRTRTREWIYPGVLYMFQYRAKWAKQLKAWDTFPLIFPVDFYRDGKFSGINFHYLNYRSRLKLFHELLTLADRAPNDPRARIRLTYSLLKSMARFDAFKPAFKIYLSSQIQSQALRIEPPDFETALFLPVENFQKMPKTKVWKMSEEIITKNKTTSDLFGEESGDDYTGDDSW